MTDILADTPDPGTAWCQCRECRGYGRDALGQRCPFCGGDGGYEAARDPDTADMFEGRAA